ncbi:MAG: hypothetical protein HY021_11875 [Burkholderiales bacterium]|nr:hypothetical protein [Burkholderiales bacterium]
MIKQLAIAFAALALCAGAAQASSHKEAPMMNADCEKKADEKKLAGAAKSSFVKKCSKDMMADGAKASCDKDAADKKLAGAAKTSFVKKCVADAGKKK